MKVIVDISPRQELLDPQGRAVQESLARQGYKIKDCRIGKLVVLDIEAGSREESIREAERIAKEVLINPLTEVYTIRQSLQE